MDLSEQKSRWAGRYEVARSGRSWLLAGSVGETLVLSEPSSQTARIICTRTPWGARPT